MRADFMKKPLAVIVSAAIFAMMTGCSHSVVIDSDPTGAQIKVNGQKVGTAPVTYTETTGWEKIYEITAEKPGYKNERMQVKQTEWNMPLTIGSAIGFFVCLFPIAGLFFARQLPDRIVVQMERGSGGGSKSSSDSSPPPTDYGY
jgi:hypothetical protein